MYAQTDGQVNNIMPPAAYYHHQFNMHKCSMNNKLNKKTQKMIQKDIIQTKLN